MMIGLLSVCFVPIYMQLGCTYNYIYILLTFVSLGSTADYCKCVASLEDDRTLNGQPGGFEVMRREIRLACRRCALQKAQKSGDGL